MNNEITLKGSFKDGYDKILTSEALDFLAGLFANFESRRQEILAARIKRQKDFDSGAKPNFLPETESIRKSDWKVRPIPTDLLDRRTEITGPVERKMIINALNSGAKVFMADFEDSLTPTWDNAIEGQINLMDAVRRTITYTNEEGKNYKLNDKTAVLIVRPRGWHLDEKHVEFAGKPVSGSLFDFGLYLFHNAKELISRKSGPYFYIPKLENHLEARLWNDVFVYAQKALGLEIGTIKATVLIEVITAAFEMEEILYEMKDHIVGLNCGRWDYIYSYIKKFNQDKNAVLPDRAQVTMTTHFLRHYSLLLIQTCHKRGAFAMGGMSAFIPVKNNPEINEKAIAAVTADKEREASDGHDGTWVAHPALVEVAIEVFNKHLGTKPNQLDKMLNVNVSAADLLQLPSGDITEAGLRNNISVSLQYIESWLRGVGCVPIFNLMEDAATAEISRSQVWQWIKHQSKLSDGREITKELVRQIIDEELNKISQTSGNQYAKAKELFDNLVTRDNFTEFLTIPAYQAVS